ncbi:5TMR of 5TMR-LYT family protein, partial [Vibrio parahaemolyticus V-223/04]
TEYFVSP